MLHHLACQCHGVIPEHYDTCVLLLFSSYYNSVWKNLHKLSFLIFKKKIKPITIGDKKTNYTYNEQLSHEIESYLS